MNLSDFNPINKLSSILPLGTIFGGSQPTSAVLHASRLQRSYNWDVLLPDIHDPFKGATGILGKIGNALQSFNPGQGLGGFEGLALAQYCQNVEFGDYSIEELVTMKYGPYQANFAGLFKVDKIKLTFLKPIPDIVTSYFYAWKNLIVDQNGLYHVKKDYQKTIYVRFLDSTGLPITKYKLSGCFPSSFPKFTLNYEDSKITTITVELAVDKIEIN